MISIDYSMMFCLVYVGSVEEFDKQFAKTIASYSICSKHDGAPKWPPTFVALPFVHWGLPPGRGAMSELGHPEPIVVHLLAIANTIALTAGSAYNGR